MLSLATSTATREDLVHSAVLRLQVLHLQDVFEPVYGAAEVDLPHGRVPFVAVLSAVDGPLAEQRRIPLLAIASLLGVDPRDPEDCLRFVEPLQAWESAAVDHADEPVSHTLWAVLCGSHVCLAL